MIKSFVDYVKEASGLGNFPDIDINGVNINSAIKDKNFLRRWIYSTSTRGSFAISKDILKRPLTAMERENFYDWFKDKNGNNWKNLTLSN
jgi:hypothetical protein